MELELLAGYAVGYLVQKFGRVFRRADEEVDLAIDAGMDRLHEVVTERLGNEPALTRLEEETEDGRESPRTRQRVRLALEEAAESDPEFAAELERLVGELRRPEGAQAGDHGLAAGGTVRIEASHGGVAAGVIHGSVSTGNPMSTEPSRSTEDPGATGNPPRPGPSDA
ncbi:hypothetical protein SAMN05444920_109247 [Nonomuraea solani]|uniref:Uncharacterized protein n=1 Tax=Nonomuraea solani TaxID=1144553 RepID=A0A1H6EE26_9ACTN|nr:chromosome partitioning protein [Nonomuraea solani]SEG96022.1 hypothetical protein SAMN05444920_109247 [Nonomuraea solani]